MRKKMLLLALALAATASLTAPSAQAGFLPGGGPYHSCPVCTTFSDGSQCCINCQCDASGTVFACPANACAEI
jgi:hypothetical protein